MFEDGIVNDVTDIIKEFFFWAKKRGGIMVIFAVYSSCAVSLPIWNSILT